MNRFFILICLLILTPILTLSCSKGNSPVSPLNESPLQQDIQNASYGQFDRILWGMYHIILNPENLSAEIIPLRTVDFTANVTRFMQPPASPMNMISLVIDPSTNFPSGYVVLDVYLNHPFPGLPQYRGFDVRGIFFADADDHLPGDLALTYGSESATHLLNPDGYTRWWNSTEFTKESIFGFWPGKLAPAVYPDAIINAYKYFCDDLQAESPLSDVTIGSRGTFSIEKGTNVRRYEIQFKMEGDKPNFAFNYAIDASWEGLGPDATSWEVEDFPLSANCNEARRLDIDTSGTTLAWSSSVTSGDLDISVTVFDWQALPPDASVEDEISGINLHSILFPSGKIEMLASGALIIDEQPTAATWNLSVSSDELLIPSSGEFDIWVEALSADPNTYTPQIAGGDQFPVADGPLAAYMKGKVTVENLTQPDSPIVIKVIPDWGYLGTQYEGIKVIGEFFTPDGLTVEFENGSYWIPLSNVTFVSATEINLDVDLKGADLGFYDVSVSVDNPIGPGVLTGTLEDGYRVGESWPQFGKNSLGNCLDFATGPQSKNDIVYTVPCETADAPETLLIGPDPDLPGERLVYFGYYSSTQNSFTAYRASDGSVKWTVEAPSPYNYYRLMAVTPPDVPGAKGETGTVYVWAYPPNHAAPEQIKALSAHDGSVLWTWTAPQNGSWLHLERFGLVLDTGDFVFCHATYNPYFYYMTCLDRDTGTVKWQIDTGGHQTPDPVLSPDGSTIYIDLGGAPSPKLAAYTFTDTEATLKWQIVPGWFPEQQSGPIVTTDGTIVCAAKVNIGNNVIVNRIFAFTDEGTHASLKWVTEDLGGDHVPWSQLAEGSDGSIYAAVGYPTAQWGPNTLFRIDGETGAILNFSDPMTGLECRSGLAVDHQGNVYAGAWGYIYAFNQDCSLKWSLTTGRCTDAALDVDGSLFVADVTNGLLYRLLTE